MKREEIVSAAIKNALTYYHADKFERVISVGDGLWDLLTAKNLDLEFIGVGLTNKEICKTKKASSLRLLILMNFNYLFPKLREL